MLDCIGQLAKDCIMPFIVPPKVQSYWASIEHMDQGLLVVVAEGTEVGCLLLPQLEVVIVGE